MTELRSAPRLIIAGASSGVGKTTVTIGIMAALRRRGLDVRPFKVGPDYIDPSYHRLACGRVSGTLDSWMLGQDGVLSSFSRTASGDISVIEGMMGLHDGESPDSDTGSTAQIAKLLECPVVLVIDGSAVARSAGAMVLGFKSFDAGVNLAGVIANRVSGERHAAYLQPSIERTGAAFLGWLPPSPTKTIPERHLGLVMPEEHGIPGLIEDLADLMEERVDIDRLLAIARGAPPIQTSCIATQGRPVVVRIAVAHDDAFCFYYPDNLALLERAGAAMVPFSPMHDKELPPGVNGVYFGGGYPEVHAGRLMANRAMRESIAAADQAGIPIFAECGGFMYLCERLIDAEGVEHEMVGLIPGATTVYSSLQAIGYRDIQFDSDTILGPAGTGVRGHEFRYSRYEGSTGQPKGPFRAGETRHGYVRGNLVASYLHLHFASCPVVAEHWVQACVDARNAILKENGA